MTSLFEALRIYLSRPKLILLGILPGIFTFGCSLGVAWFAVAHILSQYNFLLRLLTGCLVFLLAWLVVSSFALLPVEEAIIGEVQKALFNEIHFPIARLSAKKIMIQFLCAGCIAVLGGILVLLSLIPGLFWFSFILMALCTAFTFTLPIYLRIDEANLSHLFFSRIFTHLFLGIGLNFLLFIPFLNVFLLGFVQVYAAVVAFTHPKIEEFVRYS